MEPSNAIRGALSKASILFVTGEAKSIKNPEHSKYDFQSTFKCFSPYPTYKCFNGQFTGLQVYMVTTLLVIINSFMCLRFTGLHGNTIISYD